MARPTLELDVFDPKDFPDQSAVRRFVADSA